MRRAGERRHPTRLVLVVFLACKPIMFATVDSFIIRMRPFFLAGLRWTMTDVAPPCNI